MGILLIASRPDGGRVLPPLRLLWNALSSVPPAVRGGVAEVGVLHPGVGLRAVLWGVWPWFGGGVWRRMVVADRMDVRRGGGFARGGRGQGGAQLLLRAALPGWAGEHQRLGWRGGGHGAANSSSVDAADQRLTVAASAL